MLQVKTINSDVTDLASIYHPKHYDTVVTAVTRCGNFDEKRLKFLCPAVPFNLGILLKKVGEQLIVECIKQNNCVKQVEVKNFLKIIKNDFGASINKTVQENQFQNQRLKKVNIPLTDDIKKLNTYLIKKRRFLFEKLLSAFDFNIWRQLAEVTLTSVQVFNRRRAGELERTLVSDFLNYQSINEDFSSEFFQSLSEESKKVAELFVRFTIRGKLNRTVPVLLNQELTSIINLLVEHRKEAGIDENNTYLFALPGKPTSHLNACNLLRKFSILCGAKFPARLRGTNLRKHMATYSITLNLNEQQVDDLANYMGHSEKIHKDHYRMPILARDVTAMAKLLCRAQGDSDYEEDEPESSTRGTYFYIY